MSSGWVGRDPARQRIQLVGHPGTGKSSAGRIVAQRLGVPLQIADPHCVPGQPLPPRPRRWSTYARQALVNPGLARLAFSDADVQHGPTFRHLIMQLMLAVAGWNRIDRGLVDEAPIARLAWFFARHPGVDIGTWAPRIAERLPTGDVTVWLTCDPEVAWARYIQRDDPATLRDYDDEAIRASYDRYQQAAGLVLTGPLVKVDTTHSPPDDVAERIVAALG